MQSHPYNVINYRFLTTETNLKASYIFCCLFTTSSVKLFVVKDEGEGVKTNTSNMGHPLLLLIASGCLTKIKTNHKPPGALLIILSSLSYCGSVGQQVKGRRGKFLKEHCHHCSYFQELFRLHVLHTTSHPGGRAASMSMHQWSFGY